MAVYLIADIPVADESWIPDYARHVHDIAARHGGRYLSRSGRIEILEGRDPGSAVNALIEFPSFEAARTFADDPDYAPYAMARRAGSIGLVRVIDDTDLAGGIPYLGKP